MRSRRLRHPADRYGTVEPTEDLGRKLALFTYLPDEGRVGRAGTHDVACDALLHGLSGVRLGETDHAGLRTGVDRFERTADPSRIRGEIHDAAPAAFCHAWKDGLASAQGALVVVFDDRVPEALVGVDEAHESIEPGAIDEHVDRAEVCLDRRDYVAHAVGVGDVSAVGGAVELVGQRLGLGGEQVG